MSAKRTTAPPRIHRAALYARMSVDHTGEAVGITRQFDELVDLRKRRHSTEVGRYSDNDLSASSGKHRPGLAALLKDVEAGKVDEILCWNTDRLYRRPDEFEHLLNLIERRDLKLTIVGVTSGLLDLNTPDGRAMGRILVVFARREMELKGARQRLANAQRARKGEAWSAGPKPFGYLPEMVIDADEAALIREARDHVLRGGTIRALARDWTRRGVATPRKGARWEPTSLRRMLTSPRIAGIRAHHGEEYRGTWDPIITPAEHRRLDAILNDSARKRTTSTARSYLLSGGTLRCSRCSAAMVAHPRGSGKRAYACTVDAGGCGRMSVDADGIEAYIGQLVVERLMRPGKLARFQRAAMGGDAEASRLVSELTAVRAKRAEARELWAADKLDDDDLADMLATLKRREAALRERIEAAATSKFVQRLPVFDDDAKLGEWWEGADLDQRRELLALVIERIDLQPCRPGLPRFDSERVLDHIVWRTTVAGTRAREAQAS